MTRTDRWRRFRFLIVRLLLLPLFAVGVVTLLKAQLAPIIQTESPFLLYFAAVALSAWFGGFLGGLLAVALSALMSASLFLAVEVSPVGQIIRLALFAMEGTLITVLTASLQRQRQRAERSEEGFRLLVNGVQDYAIVQISVDSRVASWNAGAERIKGYTADEIIGQFYTRFFPEDAIAAGRPAALLEEAARVGRVAEEGYRVRKDGSLFLAHVVITPIRSRTGALQGYAKVIRDITAQRQAQQAVRESEIRFRAAFEQAAVGMAHVGLDGRWLRINQRLYDLLGYTPDELQFMTFQQLTHPDDWTAESSHMQQMLAGEAQCYQIEKRYIHKAGHVVWATVTVSLAHNHAGMPDYVILVAEDITTRKADEAQIRRHLERLAALRAIDVAIMGAHELDQMLHVVLEQVVAQLRVDAAAILLIERETHSLTFRAGVGFRGREIEQTRLRIGEGFAGMSALERRRVSVNDVHESPVRIARTVLFAEEEFSAYHAVPLIVKDVLIGVLEVFLRADVEMDGEWLNFLETLGGQTAIAVDSAQLFADLQRSNALLEQAYEGALKGWIGALDLRDKETEGHTQRVTRLTVRLAERLGITGNALQFVRYGALLHDIGKIGVPDNVLLKPGPLTDDEWVIMKRHPTLAYNFLESIAYLHSALDIPYCHHEWYDGSEKGYPRRLKGEAIPLSARIFAVVDVFDALVSDRPYRRGWPPEKVLSYLESQAGTHFDPVVVAAFVEMIRDAGNNGSGNRRMVAQGEHSAEGRPK